MTDEAYVGSEAHPGLVFRKISLQSLKNCHNWNRNLRVTVERRIRKERDQGEDEEGKGSGFEWQHAGG